MTKICSFECRKILSCPAGSPILKLTKNKSECHKHRRWSRVPVQQRRGYLRSWCYSEYQRHKSLRLFKLQCRQRQRCWSSKGVDIFKVQKQDNNWIHYSRRPKKSSKLVQPVELIIRAYIKMLIQSNRRLSWRDLCKMFLVPCIRTLIRFRIVQTWIVCAFVSNSSESNRFGKNASTYLGTVSHIFSSLLTIWKSYWLRSLITIQTC